MNSLRKYKCKLIKMSENDLLKEFDLLVGNINSIIKPKGKPAKKSVMKSSSSRIFY